jgi:hypothetical protein
MSAQHYLALAVICLTACVLSLFLRYEYLSYRDAQLDVARHLRRRMSLNKGRQQTHLTLKEYRALGEENGNCQMQWRIRWVCNFFIVMAVLLLAIAWAYALTH